MDRSEPKFKIGDKVKYHTGTKVGTVKRIVHMYFCSEPFYVVEGLKVIFNRTAIRSLEAEIDLELADLSVNKN